MDRRTSSAPAVGLGQRRARRTAAGQCDPRPGPRHRRAAAAQPDADPSGPARGQDLYARDEIVNQASDFMGVTAEAAGGAVERIFQQNGRLHGLYRRRGGLGRHRHRRPLWPWPALYPEGQAAGRGLLAGPVGRLGLRRQRQPRLHRYNLFYPDMIFQRFPGVEGSAYFVGGLGVNYQKAGGVTLAPFARAWA